MKITYQPSPAKCIWHSDCEHDNRSSPMRPAKHEPGRTLMECTACGKQGYYPVGGVGGLTVEEVTPNAAHEPTATDKQGD